MHTLGNCVQVKRHFRSTEFEVQWEGCPFLRKMAAKNLSFYCVMPNLSILLRGDVQCGSWKAAISCSGDTHITDA